MTARQPYGIATGTNVGTLPTRPPAESRRARMIRFARIYAAFARRAGFRYVAQICEIAATALEALTVAEQRVAELERRLGAAPRDAECFEDETTRRSLTNQELSVLQAGGKP